MINRYVEIYNQIRFGICIVIAIFLSGFFTCMLGYAHVDLIGFEGVHLEVDRAYERLMEMERLENFIYDHMQSSDGDRGTVGQND